MSGGVRWLLAKYNTDIERREPQNIGVILIAGEVRVARFIGESPQTGRVDGRAVRFIRSAVAYRQWIAHWRRMLGQDDLGELLALSSTGTFDQNYYLEPGGEILMGADNVDALSLLDDLFTRLVDDTPDTRTEDVTRLSEKVVVPLEHRLPKPISRESLVQVQVGDSIDELRFDYRYNNGVPHLMQKVSLTFGDARSWDRVHATAWTFSQVHQADDEGLKQAQLIALVKPRDADRTLNRQLMHLERNAYVVDVTHVEEAQAQLMHLFGES